MTKSRAASRVAAARAAALGRQVISEPAAGAAGLGARLKAQRLARGWSHRDLAAAAGVAQRAPGKIEQGGDSRTLTVEKLAEALGVDPALLVGWASGVSPAVSPARRTRWVVDV